MANQEHLEILKQGVEVWNRWREENPKVRPDLRGADLQEADLGQVDLTYANLTGANLSRAKLAAAILRSCDLTGANLIKANLVGAIPVSCDLTDADLTIAALCKADLRWADLTRADMLDADLSGANLERANLIRAHLIGANLTGANLSNCYVGFTTFGDVDLTEVAGLHTVSHQAASTIGIDTIYRSKGEIPEVFLKGAGVPEDFVRYIPSLLAQPFQLYTCFLCHSGKDRRFNERLHADLRAKGVRVWYFPEDATWGKTVWGEIDRSIRLYDKLVVVCSEHSLQSGPVLREIERALQREDREGKNILFPIRIDDYLFGEWEHPSKPDVKSKVVGDFRGWDESEAKYDVAFQRLLNALQAGD
mgnify:CR=1 FL=1